KGLLQRVGAHCRIVRRERAVAKCGIRKEIRRRHRDDETGFGEGRLEGADDSIAFGGRRVNRNEIVVVKIDAEGADLAQSANRVDWVEHRPGRQTEWIGPSIADGPETKRKTIGR